MEYLNNLNENQKQAVLTTEGPLLILAGAGSGKTRTIISRIAYILEQKLCYPREILAITFTNKAAKEMRSRIEEYNILETENMWMSTFHSACARILRSNAKRIGYKNNFTILDVSDQKTIIKNLYKKYGLDEKNLKISRVISKISQYKTDGITPEEAYKSRFSDEKIIANIYEDYNKKLKNMDAMDFDDLLINTNLLLKNNQDVLRYYQDKFKYILVDEFQDTNTLQNDFIKMLAARHRNICVCGDEDQSIYSWRGAKVQNILNFTHDWNEAKVIKLEENYRSTPQILACANSVISNNQERLNKKLYTDQTKGEPVKVSEYYDGLEEAEKVKEQIKKLLDENYSADDIAILYRLNAQSRVFEDALRLASIPYKTVGSLSFYARKEVKDILAYLSVINNPDDDIALNRIINIPKRGIGAVSLERLEEFATFKGWSLYQTILNIHEVPTLTPVQKTKYKAFRDLIESFRDFKGPISELIKQVYERSGYKQMLSGTLSEKNQTRMANVEELVTAATQFESTSPNASLTDFLEMAALSSSTEEFNNEGAVSLMTLHSAKGLEFPIVFLVGVEENLFPSYQNTEGERLEEERRLCYVGITRAMRKLFISYANMRVLYGNMGEREPSRFIEELPEDYIEFLAKEREAVIQTRIFEQGRAESGDNLYVGDDVNHEIFGRGKIIQINDNIATTAFRGEGIKQIALSFLSKI